MPAKTKRQKLLAEKHRQFIASSPSFTIPAPTQKPVFSVAPAVPMPKTTTGANEFALERRDMVRTIFLGLTAITIEFGMYWLGIAKH